MKKYMNKMKKELLSFIKDYPVCVYFIISNFINSIFLRLFTSGTFFVRALFFDLGILLILGFLSLCLKGKKRNIYYIVVSIVLMIICIANAMYYNYYSSFVSVSLIYTSVFLKDFGDVVVSFALKFSDLIYLWQIIGLILMILKFKNVKFEKSVRKTMVFMISIWLLFIGSVLPPYNAWSRFLKLWNRVSVVDSFGVYMYQVDDIVQSLSPTFATMFGHDEALKKVNEYYEENTSYQSKNEYTGMFEGKNVIAIHAESLQDFVIGLEFDGKEVTPNLNKLIKESLYFNNFYAQVGVGTSSDTEFTYATSLMPSKRGTAFVNYFDNKFITIQNLLKDKGYYTFSMHGNVGDFWNRNVMHKNMGYENYYSKSSFEIDEEFGLGLSDESFFRQAVPMIKEIKENIGEPYYGTLITLTNHTPWNDVETYSDYEIKWTGEIDSVYTERYFLEDFTIGDYIKSVNYMDKCIGQFLKNMEKEGLMDNTVIVIYGDHDARINGLEFDYLLNYNPQTNDLYKLGDPNYTLFTAYDYEIYKNVPLIVWSKDLDEPKVIDTPMGMIDVMPTLGNMLNVYNKYALGTDIMEIEGEDNLIVFTDGSYLTKEVYYSASNNEIYTLSGRVISDFYLKNNLERANNLLNISDKIITYDLIDELK